MQLLTGFVGSSSAVIGAVTSMLGASLSLGAMLIVSLLIDPIATIVVIAALVGLGSVLAPIRRRIRLRSQVAARYGLAFGNAVSELGVLGLEMQTYGVRDQFSARIEELTVAEATARRRADVLRGALAPTYTALAYGALVLGLTVEIGRAHV